MYTIMESSMTRYSDGVQMSRVVILVDTASDIPQVNVAWDAGSICIIADDQSYKMLNNAREWA